MNTSLIDTALRRSRVTATVQRTLESSVNARERGFVLRYIQPGLEGLMDGSVSTLAPIFATAFATHRPFTFLGPFIPTPVGVGMNGPLPLRVSLACASIGL